MAIEKSMKDYPACRMVNNDWTDSEIEREEDMIDVTDIGTPHIYITGSWANIEETKMGLYKSIFSEKEQKQMQFKPYLLQMFSGRELSRIREITDSTATSCFMNTYTGRLVVVGQRDGVLRATEIIQKECTEDEILYERYHFVLSASRCRYLERTKQYEIWSVMKSYAVYVEIALLNATDAEITIYSRYKKSADEAWLALLNLTLDFFTIDLVTYEAVNISAGEAFIASIATSSNTEIQICENHWLISGAFSNARDALQICNTTIHLRQCSAILDIHPSYEDFITGKKNGKFNKIFKETGCPVKISELNNESLLRIQLSSHDISTLINGAALLAQELPSEITFHIPTIHHKRIIGVGGKNIQNIMKSFGVYVKFINPDEFKLMGGSLVEELNVLARTPAKNAKALFLLRKEVERLTRDDTTELVERRKYLMGIRQFLMLKNDLIYSDMQKSNFLSSQTHIDGTCSLIFSGYPGDMTSFYQNLKLAFHVYKCSASLDSVKKLVGYDDKSFCGIALSKDEHLNVQINLKSCQKDVLRQLRQSLILYLCPKTVSHRVDARSKADNYSLENVVSPPSVTNLTRRSQSSGSHLRISTAKPSNSIPQQVLKCDSRNSIHIPCIEYIYYYDKINRFSCVELEYLLELLHLGALKEQLRSIDLDFELFLTLTESDLTELGIDASSRKKLIDCVAEIKTSRPNNDGSASSSAIITPFYSPSMSASHQHWPNSPFNLRNILSGSNSAFVTDERSSPLSHRLASIPQSINIEFGVSAFSQPGSPMPSKSSDPKVIHPPLPKDPEDAM